MPADRAIVHSLWRLGLAAFAAVLPQQVAASCALAAQLATLHGAYSDLINGGGTPRADIGRFVIKRDLVEADDEDLVENLNASGFYDTMDQLGPVLSDMTELARNGANGEDLGRHQANIEGLAETLRGTGCFEAPAEVADDATATPSPESEAPEPDAADPEGENADVAGASSMARLSKLIEDHAPMSYLIAGAGFAALGGIGYLVRRLILRSRARAYPRFPFGGELPIADELGRRRARVVVDISRGGLMLERPDVQDPSTFERITVRLPDGDHDLTLVWENQHFFGYQFDTALTEEELASVLALDVTRADTGSTQNENSAPKGAAGNTA